ncbi:MAG: L-glutamate gamma-semialdehyde dehydrogenase [Candidatus Bipolaricaulota bacterium]|nr:L-glutamate gamma-semialdehyde dehydrogenase [Candidatus Bipolaricaulota bacterium]MCS7274670.1 L-glutamate gamma-semialdehyde dehydrogenase [Candidatus Bipolaricaulota bacterium]MDW8111498.1 L-glutamate gamma-semialdehyde dehydrogenase [Candidatus Bipolaricaulota bacterium]MDW8329632.1 L-glutamate gamma-semialdehyde dehydrogenase [Candidatus Bipolaricaulota bacterium]
MSKLWRLEKPQNDVNRIPTYAPGTPERTKLLQEIETLKRSTEEIPLIINGEPVKTGQTVDVVCPHDHKRVLARAHLAGAAELRQAIEAALEAHQSWSTLDGYDRAAIFSKAADLLAGPRRIQNIAAIMTNQSKTPFEAEIDLAELVDFWRFNAYYMQFLYEQQPDQIYGEINRFDWRPLEGFILAVPPFNFYSIGGNLPTAPALVGNVALWKPARSVILSNYRIMQVLMEAGMPKGVINFVPFASQHSHVVLQHPYFAGLHFTGSYETLIHLWNEIGKHLPIYRNFPRIVGETGGKDFIFVHPSADLDAVVANTIRGAFEYQGQKCSAASRLYAPQSLWPALRQRFLTELPKLKVGPVDDLSVFMGAIITQDAFDKIVSYIEEAKKNPKTYEIVYGGEYDSSTGWFVQPTVIVSCDPKSTLMTEEIFGPVLTVYVYPDAEYEKTLRLCDESTNFALTGSIFAQDRQAIVQAERLLRYAAGNFYINDKPTGAVVGRQPFGGARHSGTNDKAGSWINLIRWLSPRTIKETLVPPKDWRRPYMGQEA